MNLDLPCRICNSRPVRMERACKDQTITTTFICASGHRDTYREIPGQEPRLIREPDGYPFTDD